MRTLVGWMALGVGVGAMPLLAQTFPVQSLPSQNFPSQTFPVRSYPGLILPAAESRSGVFNEAALAPLPEAPGPSDAIMARLAISNPPCPTAPAPGAVSAPTPAVPCGRPAHPYTRFLDSTAPSPLTPEQKALLAYHSFRSPGNLLTVAGTSAYTIATNAHTAYGPGWGGFGVNVGDSLLQEATGEFFGTFLIPSLAHEDPRYHRMPNASIPRRVMHAVIRTVVAQSDDGHLMPNYANLLGGPICAEIGNLYVPGIQTNGPSTVARIVTGFATAPEDTLITEFLPDVARHIHIHVILVQRILNPVQANQYPLQ